MTEDHGKCPNCGADLNGGSIWQHFYDEFTSGKGYWKSENGIYDGGNRLLSHEEAERVADEVASSYGATRTKGQWGRAIAIYDRDKDRTVAFSCPDCDHQWPRVGRNVGGSTIDQPSTETPLEDREGRQG